MDAPGKYVGVIGMWLLLGLGRLLNQRATINQSISID